MSETKENPYIKPISSVYGNGQQINVDVYCVIRAFKVEDPGLQHALKKILMPGERGDKSYVKDLEEAVVSIKNAILHAPPVTPLKNQIVLKGGIPHGPYAESPIDMTVPFSPPGKEVVGPFRIQGCDQLIQEKAKADLRKHEDKQQLTDANIAAMKARIEAQEAINQVRCEKSSKPELTIERGWQPKFKVGQVVLHNSKDFPRLKITKVQEFTQTYKAHFANDTEEIPFDYTWMESELLEAPAPTCFWEFKERLMQDQWKGIQVFKCRYCKASELVSQESDLPKRTCIAQQ